MSVYAICDICGRTYAGTTCLKCTLQAIEIGDFGVETIGAPTIVPTLQAGTVQTNSEGAKLKMPGTGLLYGVSKPVCRLGMDTTNDIVLAGDETIARFHAQILFEDGDYVLRDLGTRDGTWLNGQRITFDPFLFDGDHIRIGPYKFYFISDLA